MNYTFHLTDKCNLNCKYCYQGEKGCGELTYDEIKLILDREAKSGSKRCSILFFGGEPLLKKQLIYDVVDYTKELEKSNDIKFLFSITTNAILVDREFVKVAKKNDFLVVISLDGNRETQNKNRRTYGDEETFDIVCDNAREIIKSVTKVAAQPVITKNNYMDMVKNVEYLFDVGFTYVVCAFDYTADWKDEDIPLLRKEYEKLAELYYQKSKNNNIFYLLPFENKMDLHIKGECCEEECKLAMKRVNVASDGKIYPCVQFVGKSEYEIGDVNKGIDEEKRSQLRIKLGGKENEVCKECKLRKRCKHTCGCYNIILTGDPNETSGLGCTMERMIIEISDKLGNRLYEGGINAFYKKKYFEW